MSYWVRWSGCRPGLVAGVGTVMIVASLVCAGAYAANGLYDFSLESTVLDETILDIARQSGERISFDPIIVSGLKSSPVVGKFTAEQAIEQALKHTGLVLKIAADGSFTVTIPEQANTGELSDTPLAPMVVEARRVQQGYAADSVSAATRTETSVLELPRSVSAVPHELIEDQQITTIADALRNVSGVSANVGSNAGMSPVSITIRGFDVDNAMTDGMMSAGVSSLTAPTIAYDKIEVVKGPEAIAGGRAAKFGGVVNLVTKKPEPIAKGELRSTVDSNGKVQNEIDVTGPLTENKALRGRLIASSDQDGDTDLGWDGGKNYYIAPTVGWKGEDNELLVGAELNNATRSLGNYSYTFGNRPSGAHDATPHAKDDNIDFKNRRYYADYIHYFQHDWTLNVRGQHATSDTTGKYWTVSGISGYPGSPSLNIPSGNIFEALATESSLRYESTTAQVTLTKSFDLGATKHNVLTGYDYLNTKTDQDINLRYGTGLAEYLAGSGSVSLPSVSSLKNSMVYGDSESETEEVGYFIQDQIAVGERWNLLLSARHVAFTPLNSDSSLESVKKWLYGGGAVFKVTETLSAYGSYSEGLTNSYSYMTRNGAALPPIEAKQYEVGAKLAFDDERLILTTALFQIDETNVPMPEPNAPTFYYASEGIKSRGLEVELRGRITPRLNVSVAYTNILAVNQDDGSRVYGRPRNALNVWGTYKVAENWTVGAGLDARSSSMGTGVTDWSTQSVKELDIPGQVRWDAMVRYEERKWSATLGIKNLANKTLYDAGSFGSYVYVEPQRTFTLTGSIKF